MRFGICAGVLLAGGFMLAQAQGDCAAVLKLTLPGVKITSASQVAAGPFEMGRGGGGPRSTVNLPAHCRVRGTIDQRTGVGGKQYGIQFELRMPANWTGRFLYQGGGGTDGAVNPALGTGSAGGPALARGFAVVSTDSGHEGGDASFGLDEQARLDYAYSALGRLTPVAKQIVAAYYGRAPQHSYFMGCSNGGRQGMLLTQRFPLEYDGVVAGDPGFRLSHAAMAEAWDTQALLEIAPKDDAGRPVLSQAFTDADLKLVGNEVLKACDANDGLKDGLIDNPESCRFDPAVLTCKGAKNETCLSAAQVNALHKIFGGAVDSSGRRIYSSWPYDAGIGAPGWRIWKLGTSKTSTPNAINTSLGFGAIKQYFVTPFDPAFDPAKFDFDRDPERIVETSAINDAIATQLSTFSGHGGKLLIYQGMSDPVFSANDIIGYYLKLEHDNGGEGTTQNWARMFLVPGMNHCAGGPALDTFDSLSAVVEWVEKGTMPDHLTATGSAFPGRSRPLCPYPQQPHYNGTGSTEDAANFSCR